MFLFLLILSLGFNVIHFGHLFGCCNGLYKKTLPDLLKYLMLYIQPKGHGGSCPSGSPSPASWSCWCLASGGFCCTMWLKFLLVFCAPPHGICWYIKQWSSHVLKTSEGGSNQTCSGNLRYRVKRNGASTVPWGAPVLLSTTSEVHPSTVTYCSQPIRQSVIQLKWSCISTSFTLKK